jgi:hypothetical protein
MADMLMREGVSMAANQPREEKKTMTATDRVIDSRITKQAKRKTLSLADILQPTTQNREEVNKPAEPPTITVNEQYNAIPPEREYLSSYRNPSAQQISDDHATEAEGLKLLEDILEMSVDEERPEPMISENVPTSNPQCRAPVRKREFERAPPIQMLRGQKQYDMEEVLQSIQLEISLAQLLDASAS